MATYLIDYENVKSEGIKGVAQLGEDDRVVIFYSHNADTITFEAMDMIFNSKAQITKYKILCGGKNALDFQLSTYLGYLIHEAKDSYFYIISKDNGFKHVVDFWKRTFRFDGYVYCFATIADGNARQNRFKNATAKERARVMEEELVAMSEELEAQSDAEEAEETENAQEQEVLNAPAEEPASEEAIEKQETVSEEITEKQETVSDETAEELVTDETIIDEVTTSAGENASDEAEKENAESVEETTSQTTEQPIESESQEPISDTMIYPVQQHKPVSVMPPAELPDSIRKELEKADAQYQESSEEDLKEKIAAAVSASTIKVVESGMTVHHVEKSEPVQDDSKTEKAVKHEKNTHHAHHSGRRKKNAEQTAEETSSEQTLVTEETPKKKEKTPKAPKTPRVPKAQKAAKPAKDVKSEEQPKEVEMEVETEVKKTKAVKEVKETKKEPKKTKSSRTAKVPKQAVAEIESRTEEKPEKPARKPITRSTRARKIAAVPAEESAAPAVQEAKEKPAQEKPVRRGRRPKAQSNIAASFE